MKLFVYSNPMGITYTDKKTKIGKLVGVVDATSTDQPIENENVIFANIGIFKVKMKIIK